jgi:hypothetical protein
MPNSLYKLLTDQKMKLHLDMMATELGSAERQVYVQDLRDIEKRLSSANRQSA